MVSTTTFLVTALVALLAAPTSVDAHGYLQVPKAKLASSGDPTKYASRIYGPSALTPPAGMKFSDTIQNNLKAFTTAFKTAGWSSLASFIKKKSPEAGQCGTTSLDPSNPQTVGNYVQWSSFVESHVGPCEVWCDSKRVFHNDNCAGAYPSVPAKLPINQAKCAGAKQLVFYWLALHEEYWQVYINCVSLKGKETRSIDDDDSDDSETSTAVTTVDEERAAKNTDCDDDLPEPDCDDNLPEPDCDTDLPDPTKEADCDQDYPEPSGETGGDADCDDNLPEPDCDDNLPEPDCDNERSLPEPDDDDDTPSTTTKNLRSASDEGYSFDTLKDGYTPGKAEAATDN